MLPAVGFSPTKAFLQAIACIWAMLRWRLHQGAVGQQRNVGGVVQVKVLTDVEAVLDCSEVTGFVHAELAASAGAAGWRPLHIIGGQLGSIHNPLSLASRMLVCFCSCPLPSMTWCIFTHTVVPPRSVCPPLSTSLARANAWLNPDNQQAGPGSGTMRRHARHWHLM